MYVDTPKLIILIFIFEEIIHLKKKPIGFLWIHIIPNYMETLHLLWITSNKMFGSYIKVSYKQTLGMRMYSCIQSTSDPSRCNPDILTSESDWKLEFCSFQLAIVVCHTKTQDVNNEKFRRRLFSKYKLCPKEFI